MQVALNLKNMSKKIVIDKESIDKFHNEVLINGLNSALQKYATEIDTDQSIDFEGLLSAELDKLPYTIHLDDGGFNDGQVSGFELGARWMKQIATEQDLISKAREKENSNWWENQVKQLNEVQNIVLEKIVKITALSFSEWIAENDYIRSTNGRWYYKSDGEIEKGITTEDLFNQFTNQYKK